MRVVALVLAPTLAKAVTFHDFFDPPSHSRPVMTFTLTTGALAGGTVACVCTNVPAVTIIAYGSTDCTVGAGPTGTFAQTTIDPAEAPGGVFSASASEAYMQASYGVGARCLKLTVNDGDGTFKDLLLTNIQSNGDYTLATSSSNFYTSGHVITTATQNCVNDGC